MSSETRHCGRDNARRLIRPGKPPALPGDSSSLTVPGNISAIETKVAPFPLTPALSPEERGNPRPRLGKADARGLTPSRDLFLPLLGERAGVRGNGATSVSMAEMFPGTVQLEESPGRAGGFPGQMTFTINHRHGPQQRPSRAPRPPECYCTEPSPRAT